MRMKRSDRKGQALVEGALILLLFLAFFVGTIDFGQFLYFHQSLTERARAAARYGAVHTYSGGSDSANVAVYNDPAGTANGATALLPDLTTGIVGATLSGAGTDDARITVTISNYPYNFVSPYMSKSTWFRTILASEPYEIGH